MEANFSAITNALSWTIIHSLWQGGIIFIFLVLYFIYFKKSKAKEKYVITFSSLTLLFISTIITFIVKLSDSSSSAFHSENIQSIISNFNIIIEVNNANSFTDFINRNSNQISNIWLIGTFLFFLKYLISYFYLITIRRNNENVNLTNYGIDFKSICNKIGVNKSISIKNYSEFISPFTVGFIKPFIFFPISLLSQLSCKEIECILAHELAHIKRKDYLFNTIATFIEVLMYYHPVVWWMQKKLSIYREEDCDDIAVEYIQDPIVYAKSLLTLQELLNKENNVPALSMGFINNKKSILLNRIKRMFNMNYSHINIKEKLAASLFIFLFALSITELYAYKTERNDYSLLKNLKEIYSNPFYEMESDTIPKPTSKKKEKISILKDDGERSIAAKIEDGEIKELKVDGKEIPKEEYDQYSDVIEELKPMEGRKSYQIGEEGGVFSFDDFHFDTNEFKNWGKEIDNWEDKIEAWGERRGKEMEKLEKRYEKDMHKWEKDMEKWGKKNHNFVFPHGINDSTLHIYQLHADSMMKLADVYRWKADSLLKFNFEFPHDLQNQFRIMIPDGGNMNFDIPEFDFDNNEDFYIHEDNDKNWNFPKHKSDNNNLEELIGKQLNKDGFLIANEINKVELSGKHLKINGEKQPSNIWNKYKNLFERETGMPLHKDTKLVFNVEGKESKRKYKAF